MNRSLFYKIFRDLRLPLVCVGLLLFAFEFLFAKITDRIINQIMPLLTRLTVGAGISFEEIERDLLAGPGQIIRAMMGGDMIDLTDAQSTLSMGYVHPLIQVVVCAWAIGKSAAAISGEIDRGTMELLLAQPVSRLSVIWTHFTADVLIIPFLCLCMLGANWAGVVSFELPNVDLVPFSGAALNVAALMFAVKGYTMLISALGRSRWRVVGISLGITLVQFIINLIGQMWPVLEPWRKYTVFYYYRPQPIILGQENCWQVSFGSPGGDSVDVPMIGVLLGVGLIGYLLSAVCFCRRDLPPPL